MVRRYDIKEQMDFPQNTKPNHDGNLTIQFSQDTIDTIVKDNNF